MWSMTWSQDRGISIPGLTLLAVLKKLSSIPFELLRNSCPDRCGSSLLRTLHPCYYLWLCDLGCEKRRWGKSIQACIRNSAWMYCQSMQTLGTISPINFQGHINIGSL